MVAVPCDLDARLCGASADIVVDQLPRPAFNRERGQSWGMRRGATTARATLTLSPIEGKGGKEGFEGN